MRHLNISKTFITVFLLIMAILCATTASAIPVEVTVNKSMLINTKKPIERITVAQKEIVDFVFITPKQVQVNGIKAGTTSLNIWEKGNERPTFFDVYVIPQNYEKADDKQNFLNSRQVLLQVRVAQVDKTAMRDLGVSFSVKNKNAEGFTNLIGNPAGGIGSSSSALGTFNPLDAYTFGISHFPSGTAAVLKALETKNLARILAEPNLVVRNGAQGEFLAGSEIPYAVVNNSGGMATTSIIYKEVGIKLRFAPIVMPDGSIFLKINPARVSTVSGTLMANGYPIIDTKSVDTDVILKDGECLVMAGLLSEETVKAMSKVPWLGDIPILGALFRSTTDEIKERELIFFITPKLIEPSAPGTKPDLPTDKKLTPEQEREMQWIPMFK